MLPVSLRCIYFKEKHYGYCTISGYALPHGALCRPAINDKMNGNDLLNPESMIKAQFALQQYSTFINYESSLIKMIKDMLSGIIAKI